MAKVCVDLVDSQNPFEWSAITLKKTKHFFFLINRSPGSPTGRLQGRQIRRIVRLRIDKVPFEVEWIVPPYFAIVACPLPKGF
jgi:hypothetical protein